MRDTCTWLAAGRAHEENAAVKQFELFAYLLARKKISMLARSLAFLATHIACCVSNDLSSRLLHRRSLVVS